MDINRLNNKIIIVKDEVKEEIVKLISLSDKFLSVKIITLSDLKKKYFFDYTKKTRVFIRDKYNVINEIADIYIDNLYYIKDIDNDKINFLKEVKEELDNNNSLIYNDLFKEYLKGKDIILWNLDDVDKFYENIFDELRLYSSVEVFSDEIKKTKKDIYEAKNREEEISFVAEEVCKLLDNGVQIKNVKLANVTSDYSFTIKKIFGLYNIPVNLGESVKIKSTKILKAFKDNYEDEIETALEEAHKLCKTERDNNIYRKIVDVVSEYNLIEESPNKKESLFYDLDNIVIRDNKWDNAASKIDFINSVISDEDYVFLIGFNEGIFPITYKDEDYLSDDIKERLGISTSFDLNKKLKNRVIKRISSIKNLVVTYSTHDITDELYVSSIYSDDLFNKKEINQEFKYSDKYNKLVLTSAYDENNKYGTTSEVGNMLASHYKDFEYLTYDNSFKGINKESFFKYMNNKIDLSYSSLNELCKCSFRYYLDYVLRVSPNDDTFAIAIGNIYHGVLEKSYNDDFDFEVEWKREVDGLEIKLSNMEKFYLEALHDELIFILDTIRKQEEHSKLKKHDLEKRILINVNKDPEINFKGFIDKMTYDEIDGEKILVIVDYKTGNPELSINEVPYGINMQLPVYVYLAKNEKPDYKVGGFYLQKILSAEVEIEKKRESLKLQGYSNEDIRVLKIVDETYEDSEVIKSLKTSSNGFYAYSKILNDKEIDKLYNLVEEKVKEACKTLLDADFRINPKSVDGKLLGCDYCKYKDICFRKNEDIVDLEKLNYKDFLKEG